MTGQHEVVLTVADHDKNGFVHLARWSRLSKKAARAFIGSVDSEVTDDSEPDIKTASQTFILDLWDGRDLIDNGKRLLPMQIAMKLAPDQVRDWLNERPEPDSVMSPANTRWSIRRTRPRPRPTGEALMTVSETKLLPCPFCGPGNSMVDPWFDDVSKRWAIGCGRCGSSSGRSIHAEGSKEAAIKSWNTRGLTAALSDQAGGWQDISTAPKDGTAILLSGVFHGKRWIMDGAIYDLGWIGGSAVGSKPDRWQPLPAPPPSSTAGE